MLISYLRKLPAGKLVLWCYLIWYLTITTFHFDPSPRLWLSSAGIAAIIGVALCLSVSTPGGPLRDPWQTARLFMMPFFVSSYAALIKDQGFILVLSPRPAENLVAAALCLLFAGTVRLLQRYRP